MKRFFCGRQTAQSNISGTGLGLGIVKEIVNLHQGWIDVDSQVGKGSRFQSWLPCAQAVPVTPSGKVYALPVRILEEEWR